MIPLFDALRGVDLASVTANLFLAVLCGGIIGLERSNTNHDAGMRTHSLVCLGAATVMIISERMNAGRHTIITTNLNESMREARYGERRVSRLFTTRACLTLALTGEDLRR